LIAPCSRIYAWLRLFEVNPPDPTDLSDPSDADVLAQAALDRFDRQRRSRIPSPLLEQMDEAFRRLLDHPCDAHLKEYERCRQDIAANGADAEAPGYRPPVIAVRHRLIRDVSKDMLPLLHSRYAEPLYNRAGHLTRVNTADSPPRLEIVTDDYLRGLCDRVATFMTVKGPKGVPQSPPWQLVKDLQSYSVTSFPRLEGLTECPVVRPDGSLLTTPGYDAATQLFYTPVGSRPASIPRIPTPVQVQEAIRQIGEVFCDFPFVDSASRAAAWAGLLTVPLRPFIRGPVPLLLMDAPQAGSGKSLLATVIAIITTGRPPAMMPPAQTEDEWRKRILSLLLEGRRFIVLDNIDEPLDSTALATALTSEFFEDRLLGQSQIVRVVQNAVWVVTGNNIRLKGDLPRRCVLCRIDAKLARPWRRGAFKHPDLLRWATFHRTTLLHHLLVIIQGWITAGKPQAVVPVLGGFTAWAETVGSVLSFADIKEFLGNLERFHGEADEHAAECETFLARWHKAYADAPVLASTLVEQFRSSGALEEILPSDLADDYTKYPGSFQHRLGRALRRYVDVRFGAYRLVRHGTSHHAVQWKVIREG
jgi:hypothetical protein